MLSVRGSSQSRLSSYGSSRQRPAAISAASAMLRRDALVGAAARRPPSAVERAPRRSPGRRRRRRGRPAGARRSPPRRGRPGSASCRGPISAPCRVVHMFSAAPNARSRSDSASSRCAVGVAKPPEMPTVERVAGEEPVGHGGGRQHGAESARRARAAPGPAPDSTAPRPAMIAGRSAPRERRDHGGQVARRDRGRASGAGGGRRELDRPPPARRAAGSARRSAARRTRAPHRPRGVGDRGRGPVHPLGHRADRLDERVLVDLEVRAQLRRGRVRGQQHAPACGSSPPRSAP